MADLELEDAKEMIAAAEARAEKLEQPMVIAVANSEGNLVAQHRMDDAWPASVSISRNKAYTAAALKTPTHELAEPSQPGNPLYGLQTADEGRIVIFGGGYPIERDGEVVGAIGVSGGEVSEDREVAEAGVEAWYLKLPSHYDPMIVNPGPGEGTIDPRSEESVVEIRQSHPYHVAVEEIQTDTLRFGPGESTDVRDGGGVAPTAVDVEDDDHPRTVGDEKLVVPFPTGDLNFGAYESRSKIMVSVVFETHDGREEGYSRDDIELVGH